MTDHEFADWTAKVTKSSSRLSSEAYKKLAMPSEKSPVEYFSAFDSQLYQGVLREARGEVAPFCAASEE
jgi:cytochrome o ubiquinol oxidase subunit II